MSDRPTSNSGMRAAVGVLAVFVLAFGLWDWVALGLLHDTFLPPAVDPAGAWGEGGDWSAAHCYATDWKTALARWATAALPDPVVTALAVLAVHALLWSGVYFVGRALFEGSPWVALLCVGLVRICPDFFGVDLLSARDPSRLAAIALAFWSIGLTIRRRWVAACCAGGLIAQSSPTVACWFAQFIVVALFGFNPERGWRRSAIGAACFLVLATGPVVRFVVGEVVPAAPLSDDAMLGLHVFADPSLSPFSVPLWSYVCLTVYLAMAFHWMRPYFRRRVTPAALVFFLIGLAGLLIEIIFVGVVPVERAARFELQTMRAFWVLWIPLFYAPVLRDDLRHAWRTGRTSMAMARGLLFAVPVVWSGLTLLNRLYRPPRWNRAIVAAMLLLLFLTAFVFSHGDRPVAEAFYALIIGALAAAGTVIAGLAIGEGEAWRLAASTAWALVCVVLVWLLFEGGSVGRAVAQMRRTVRKHAAWKALCHSPAVEQSPATSKWAVPWHPRQFRRWTGRAVLVNRWEVPRAPDERFQWFRRYTETHATPVGSRNPDQPGDPGTQEEVLRLYRRALWLGVGRRTPPGMENPPVRPAAAWRYGVRCIIGDDDVAPRAAQRPSAATARVRRIAECPPLAVYAIDLAVHVRH